MTSPQPIRNQSGFTMIELMVSLFLSTVVAYAIFYAYGNISRGELQGTRKAVLELETQRLGRTIINGLRRAPEVYSVRPDRISYLHSVTNDTVVYEQDQLNNQLLRNGNPVSLLAPNAKVSTFIISQEPATMAADSGLLVSLNIGMSDTWGDSTSLIFRVALRSPPTQDASENLNWNF